jgi:hypothetical protein
MHGGSLDTNGGCRIGIAMQRESLAIGAENVMRYEEKMKKIRHGTSR